MRNLRRIYALSLAGFLITGLAACQGQGDYPIDSNAPIKDAKECVTKITPAAAPSVSSDAITPSAEGSFPEITSGANFGEKPTVAPGEGRQPSEFARKILIQGTGPKVTEDVDVSVHYLGQLWDGTVFDNSYDRNSPSTFNLNQVVKGWKWGLNGTHVGDRVELIIPADLGYGDTGASSIPPNSTLIFIVDVVFAPPVISEAELAGYTQLLTKSEPTGEKLPEGLRIYCKPGSEPQLGFMENSKVPAEPSIVWTLKGKGRVITENDIVGVVGVYGSWGDRPRSNWTDGSGVVFYPAKDLGAVGKTLGSRSIVVGPPSQGAPRGVVQVGDIVAAYEVASH